MPDQAGSWRHPGWSWTMRHNRAIASGYGIAALFAGAALGVVPALVTDVWNSGQTWGQLWLCVSLGVLAVAALGFSETARRGRDRMLARNGTAYLIQEQARFWTADTAERFRAGVHRQFARVIEVPGPAEVDRWDWPLDDGARLWDGKVDELVRAFRVLNIDETRDGSATPNGVFMWAWWAAAMAFGMRVTAANRTLELDVWQRPSIARSGEVAPETWAQRPHRFRSASPGDAAVTEYVWPADLSVSRRGRVRTAGARGQVSVLLVRFSRQAWGPLPEVAAAVPATRLDLHLYDAAGVASTEPLQADLHELRCVPQESQFQWQAFPALAAEAAAWVERKTKELVGHTLLLATVMPQEVGLGLGILAGQETRRASWPEHLWPIVYDQATHEFTVPHLDLGSAAVDPAPAARRRA
jgi:hypothetical protein